MSATVRDAMTTHVVSVRKTAPFKDMAVNLREHRVRALPVLDEDDRVIGVVSEADLLAKEALDCGMHGGPFGVLQRNELARAAGVTAADVMSRPPVTIGPHDPVEAAARLMYGKKIRRLPVIDEEGRLIGIISRSDVLSVCSRPDSEIRREVSRILRDTLRADPSRFTVTVQNGIVTIQGTPESTSAGQDIIDQARHAEGVVAVRDRLTYQTGENWPPVAGSRLAQGSTS